jgi:hypothetical protein
LKRQKTKTKMKNNKDLSQINNLEDLHKEIRRVKADIKLQEQQLEERAKRFPKETLRASAGAAFPFIINNAVAARTFGIVKNVTGLFFGGSKSKATTGQKIFSAAKNLGVVTAIRTGYNLFKRIRSKKKDNRKKKNSNDQSESR